MKVRNTTNYSQFRGLVGNRRVRDAHVKKLVASIERNNLLEANPIMVNGHMEVIDGQHRLEAAKRLGLPIFYCVIGDVGIETVMDLQTSKKWQIKDVIERWCIAGNENYLVLRDFCEDYGFSVSLAKHLLSDSSYKSGATDGFIEGKFQVTKLNEALKFADKYAEIRKLIKQRFADSREFVLAFKDLMRSKNYNHARMLSKLEHSAHVLEIRDSKTDYMRDLEALYNRYERQSIERLF